MTQQYLQTLTDLLNQEDLDTRTTTVEVPSPWWTASGRSPPTRPWRTPCWGLLTTGEALTSLLEERAA